MTRIESMAVGGLIAALLLILYARSVTPTNANARPDTSADGKRADRPAVLPMTAEEWRKAVS